MRRFILAIVLINSILIGYTVYHKRTTTIKEREIKSFGEVNVDKLLFSEPLQENLEEGDLKPFKKDKFLITPIKRYRIAARILRKEYYHFGQSHEVLPVDLALGWNIMADRKTVKENKIEITQSNRFYFWHINSFDKISRQQIENNSANVHIAPYDEQIEKQIDNVDKDDLVYLEGYLVNILDETNNYRFISSLSRTDTGAGACEVLLVTGVKKYE